MKELNMEDFYNLIIGFYHEQIKKNVEKIGDMYTSIREFIDLTIKKMDSENTGVYNKLYDINDEIYSIMSKKEVVDKIKENNMKTQEAKRYINSIIRGEPYEDTKDLESKELVDGQKRRYDMSDLFNEQLFEKKDKNEMREDIIYNTFDGQIQKIYIDENKNILIKQLGTLMMKRWTGEIRDINKYLIIKQDLDGNTTSHIVYSNICIPELNNPEYKDKIVKELLSEENIKLSNAYGYIGEVVKGKINNKEEIGSTGEYRYKINDEYFLKYDPIDLTAVGLYEIDKSRIIKGERE